MLKTPNAIAAIRSSPLAKPSKPMDEQTYGWVLILERENTKIEKTQ